MRVIIAREPDNIGYQLHLCAQLAAQAGYGLRTADLPAAQRWLEEARVVVERLLQRDPYNADVQFAARVHFTIETNLYDARGDHAGSLETARRVVEHAARSVDSNRGSVELRHHYARALEWRFTHAASVAPAGVALKVLEEIRPPLVSMVNANPADPTPTLSLATVEHVATGFNASSRDEALSLLRRAGGLCTPQTAEWITEAYATARVIGDSDEQARLRGLASRIPPARLAYAPLHLRQRLDAMSREGLEATNVR
jgi:hypothetical protein